MDSWRPCEIIRMFREEQQKIVARDLFCQSLLQETDSALKTLNSLNQVFEYVSPRTSQLHSTCENILDERKQLIESKNSIDAHLSQCSLVRRAPDIKNQIVAVLSSVHNKIKKTQDQQNNEPGNSISSQVGDGLQNVDTSLEEYYGRFFVECRRIKELASQLDSCLPSTNASELLLHLEEIYGYYFDIRLQLIECVYKKTLEQIIGRTARNYCECLRQTSQLLIRLIRNEVQLFQQIFPSSNTIVTANEIQAFENPAKITSVDSFLQLLCRIFYEHLRPVVIHVKHLETLAELYKLVGEHETSLSSQYGAIMSLLAEDIQERLIFRSEVFLQESVLDYKPSAGDLAYPEKLEIVCNGDLKDYQSMWYPTVQRTVLALFHMRRVLGAPTFRELAQEAVIACLKSLDVAQKLIDERHGGTKIEATLFLSKHLEILRDQLHGYAIERVQLIWDTDSASVAVTGARPRELDVTSLEPMLALFRDSAGLGGLASGSFWAQLNATIVSGTRWTLQAARLQAGAAS